MIYESEVPAKNSGPTRSSGGGLLLDSQGQQLANQPLPEKPVREAIAEPAAEPSERGLQTGPTGCGGRQRPEMRL